MKKRILFAIVVSVFVNSVLSSTEESLVSVVVLARHGARTPLKAEDVYSSIDPWKNDGSLTQVGIAQQYALGGYLRKNYIVKESFLSDIYNPK